MSAGRRSRLTKPPAIATGAVALAILVIGLVIDPREIAATLLVGLLAATSTVLGVLTMIMIAHVSNATWFAPFRRRADAIVGVLPALAAIGVLPLLGLPVLYVWVERPTPNAAYLNVPFFLVRWIVYWAAWIAIAESLRATCRIENRGEIERAAHRYRVIASVGLPVVALTMSFAAFDWMMSLAPDWHSTIYAVYWFAGGMVSALALLALLVVPRFSGHELPTVFPDDLHALGKLLLTFVLFWLYIGFAQYIVIWSGDLPAEVTWYIARTRDGWGYVAAVLVFGTFVFPFLLLLFRFVKRSASLLAIIAVALLGLHVLDTFWLVMPGLVPVRWWTIVVTGAAVALMAGAAAALGAWRRPAEPASVPGRSSRAAPNVAIPG